MSETGERSDLRRLVDLLILVFVGWVLWRLSAILTPFVLAALIAYLGEPLVERLVGWKLPRGLAASLTLLAAILITTLVLLLVVPLFVSQASALAERLPAMLEALADSLQRLDLRLPDDAAVSELLRTHAAEVASYLRQGISGLIATGTGLAVLVGNLVLIPVVAFYMLRDWEQVLGWFMRWIPAARRELIGELARGADRALGSFLRGQLTVMAALAVIYASGLSLAGLDHAVAVGVFAGLVSFVPYLGAIVGVALALSTALLQGPDATLLGGIGVTFLIGQTMEGYVLTPRLVGDQIGLHPMLVIFAVLAGGALFGFLGVLIALPLSAVLVAAVEVFERHGILSR